MKCPICNQEIQNVTSDYEEHILLEEYAKCEDNHHQYGYQYAYGNTEERIGRVVMYFHHADSKELRTLLSKQFNAVVELEKERYVKDKEGE